MCLDLGKVAEVLIAEKDIKCYKVCLRTGSSTYRSPYQNAPIQLGVKYSSKLNVIELYPDGYGVERGLHTFISSSGVIAFARNSYSRPPVILRAVIPKGSCYYKGRFGSYGSYCSDTIIYTEVFETKALD